MVESSGTVMNTLGYESSLYISSHGVRIHSYSSTWGALTSDPGAEEEEYALQLLTSLKQEGRQ